MSVTLLDDFLCGCELWEKIDSNLDAQPDWRPCNKHKTENETLQELLNELIDCHYGVATHHIGDGDGLSDEVAEKLRNYWDAIINEKQAKIV